MTVHAPDDPVFQNAEARPAETAGEASPPPAAVYLEWSENGQARRVLIPDTGSLLLGRDPERCDLVFDHGTVSREHARILRFEGKTLLQHLSRSNPTWLNGQMVMAEAELMPGDQLQLAIVAIDIVDGTRTPGSDQDPVHEPDTDLDAIANPNLDRDPDPVSKPKPKPRQEQDEWH